MFTTIIQLYDRSKSEVVFKTTPKKTFKTTKSAEKYLYNQVEKMEVKDKDFWVVGSILNASGKLEYNIGLL